MLIDLHVHTYPRSDDSYLMAEELVKQAKAVGLDGICLTEHDGFWDPKDTRYLSEKHDFLVLGASEVNTEEGHLLVFGLDRYVFGMHRASFVREMIEERRGAVIVAHPYRRTFWEEQARDPVAYRAMVQRACENPIYRFCHGVETFNGRGLPQQNAFSQEVSRTLGLPGAGSGDAHRLEDVGRYATEFDAPIRELRDLIREVRAGQFRPAALRPSREGLRVSPLAGLGGNKGALSGHTAAGSPRPAYPLLHQGGCGQGTQRSELDSPPG
ncbi:MAG: PHP domain-containing protein [Chloroflexi bacterium]|nr:PHP domain-containing protein [Chloroflexota bacterium]